MRSKARNSLVIALAVLVVSTACYTTAVERFAPFYGDPEFSRKARLLSARHANQPTRPLVVVLGSSRVAYGLDPQTWENAGDDDPRRPMMVNAALVGSGPILQRLALRRILTLNVRIDAVLLEYWPPFLREDGPYHEAARIDPSRLGERDETVIRDHFPDPAATLRRRREHRIDPWSIYGETTLNRTQPRWLPPHRRTDAHWATLDAWGHLPGRKSATREEREAAMKIHEGYYAALFDGYEVAPVADAALRAAIDDCRSRRIAVGIVYLPETASFRARMSEATRAKVEHHERHARTTYGVPWIDARDWIADEQLPDGFHLLDPGASSFTLRLGGRLDEVLQRDEVTSR